MAAGTTAARRRRLLKAGAAGLAVIVFAMIGALVFGFGWGSARDEGPLRYDGYAVGIGKPVDTNVPVTFSLAIFENTTEQPVTIEGVEVVGRDPEVRIVGMLAAPLRGALLASSQTFPPREHARSKLKPVEGYVVRPGEEVQLFIGAKTTRGGRFGFRSLAVSYAVEGGTYELELPFEFIMCAPRAQYLGKRCGSFTRE